MILDGLLLFSAGAAYSGQPLLLADAITATAASGNVLDLGPGPGSTALPPSWNTSTANPTPFPTQQPIRDIGIGDDPAMKLLVQVVTPFTAGGAATLTVALQGAPDSGTGGLGGFVTWWTSPAYTVTTPALLTAGSRLLDMDMPRPPQGVPIPRFLRLNYTVATGPFTGGAVLSAIVLDRMDQIYNANSATGAANNAVMGGYPAGIVVQN
jgi:hypothetical protein